VNICDPSTVIKILPTSGIALCKNCKSEAKELLYLSKNGKRINIGRICSKCHSALIEIRQSARRSAYGVSKSPKAYVTKEPGMRPLKAMQGSKYRASFVSGGRAIYYIPEKRTPSL
jgi:hypothetical protein